MYERERERGGKERGVEREDGERWRREEKAIEAGRREGEEQRGGRRGEEEKEGVEQRGEGERGKERGGRRERGGGEGGRRGEREVEERERGGEGERERREGGRDLCYFDIYMYISHCVSVVSLMLNHDESVVLLSVFTEYGETYMLVPKRKNRPIMYHKSTQTSLRREENSLSSSILSIKLDGNASYTRAMQQQDSRDTIHSANSRAATHE